jgi:hypothetical protein
LETIPDEEPQPAGDSGGVASWVYILIGGVAIILVIVILIVVASRGGDK